MEKNKNSGKKLISSNTSARHNYFIEAVIEAGIVLTGTEVKSIRKTSPNLKDSYVEIKTAPGKTHFEAWLLNAHIAPYSHGNIWNHDPVQKRKLLLHSKQVDELHGAIIRKGMTIIPTQMYFVNGRVKVELGLGKGKKKHDKRDDLKEKSAEREMDRAQKSYRK